MPRYSLLAFSLLALVTISSAHADGLSSRATAFSAYALGDYATAKTLLTPLAASGDREAHWRLAMMYVNANGAPADNARAMHHFRAAADAGHPRSYYDVGLMYELGEGRKEDPDAARRWYERGLNLDCGECARQLGLGLVHDGVIQDAAKAERLFTLAARQGDARGKELLARLRMGQNGEAAIDEALRLLDEAISQGSMSARLGRAELLWSSNRRPEDAAAGVRELRALTAPLLDTEFTPPYRAYIRYQLLRSAVQGWGMKQDWSQALVWAGSLDDFVKWHRDDLDYALFRDLYPAYDHVRALMDALFELHRDGPAMSCEAINAIKHATVKQMLPFSEVPAMVAAMSKISNDGAICGRAPQPDALAQHAGCADAVLTLACTGPLLTDALLPTASTDGIGYTIRP